MNIVIDFGNTLTKVGIIDNQEIIEIITLNSDKIKKENFVQLIEKFNPDTICFINVIPISYKILEYFQSKTKLINFNHNFILPFSINYTPIESLGIDRLAGVLGAYSIIGNNNFLVIQIGTCITYDLHLKDNGYQGGVISPGINIRNKAMNTFTHKLPLTKLNTKATPSIIGNDTNGSLNSGIINGIYFEIEGYINYLKKENKDLKIVFSGGDINYFVKRIKNKIFANPNITLKGLQEIIKINEQNK